MLMTKLNDCNFGNCFINQQIGNFKLLNSFYLHCWESLLDAEQTIMTQFACQYLLQICFIFILIILNMLACVNQVCDL